MSRKCPPRVGGDPEARHVEELSSCNFYSEMMEDPEQEKIRVSATQEGKRQKTKNFNNNKKNGEILGFLNHSIILAIFIHQ